MPNTGNFRMDDPTFRKQHLLTGKPTSNPNPSDFQKSGDSAGKLYACPDLGFVGTILGFFTIKKWKNRE